MARLRASAALGVSIEGCVRARVHSLRTYT